MGFENILLLPITIVTVMIHSVFLPSRPAKSATINKSSNNVVGALLTKKDGDLTGE